MSSSRKLRPLATIGLVAVSIFLAGSAIATPAAQRYGIGQTATPVEIKSWDIDIRGDGKGLPSGHGSVAEGDKIFATKCASCHGDFGEGNGRMPVLVGGKGTLNTEHPIQTVGSYWPYAPTLYDYIRRAMPFGSPQSLTNDEVYALTAYILNLNDLFPKDAILDAKSLAAIKMPNRNGFVKDPRPDVHNVACLQNCKQSVKVTSDQARSLGVTPDQQPAAESAAAAASAPQADASTNSTAPPAAVSFAQVQPIIAQRCATCHAEKPTQSGFSAAPAGIKLDTPERIGALTARIKQQAVSTHAMPIGNLTHMTQQERTLIGQWIAAGGKTN